jgi:hypothetical protein
MRTGTAVATRAGRALVLITTVFAALLAIGCSDASGAAGSAASGCDACHMTDFRAAPKHVGQKPTKCAVCHETYAWHPQRIDHPFYPLAGAHAKAACFDCHAGNPPQFGGTSKECVGCHRADYDRSRFPGHSNFPLTCEKCHSVSAWKPTLPSFTLPSSERAATPAPPSTRSTSTPKPPEPPRRPRSDGGSGASKRR